MLNIMLNITNVKYNVKYLHMLNIMLNIYIC
jgi:hypothetical protein